MKISYPSAEELPYINELPDPFLMPDGKRITSPTQWSAQREYLKQLLAHYVYGHPPDSTGDVLGEILSSENAYDGRAVKERLRVTAGVAEKLSFEADVLRPAGKGPHPVITWNQFTANPQICPIEEEAVCEKGYAIISLMKEQLAKDAPGENGGFDPGPFGRAYPDSDARALAIWGFGHSILISYLEKVDWADSGKIAATGFSRGGKAALCAGIFDERVAACLPMASGCGGLGSYRYLGGRLGEGIGRCETIADITDRFFFWLQDELKSFGGTHEGFALPDAFRLPFDSHTARVLIAPRALFDAECLDDTWCNGYGTQITWRAAQEVFEFLGAQGKNGIYFCDGGHKFGLDSWRALVNFLDGVFHGKEKTIAYRRFDENESDVPRLHYHWRKP